MTSPAQIAANRRNAQLSTGPRTPSGKQISSQNALRHGILSRQVLTPSEDPDTFAAHLQSLTDDLAPIGSLEELLVQQIAACYWRLARILSCDADLFGRHQEAVAKPEERNRFGQVVKPRADPVPSATLLDPLLRYERQITNQISRCLAQLDRLQQARLAATDPNSDPEPRPDQTNPITPPPSETPTSDETNPIPSFPRGCRRSPAREREPHGGPSSAHPVCTPAKGHSRIARFPIFAV